MSFNWDEVWENQSKKHTKLRDINGWEKTDMDPHQTVLTIKDRLNISFDDTLLEVGCGCGFLGEYFKKEVKQYSGLEKSQNLCNIAEDVIGAKIVCSDAANLPFKDNQFDYVVAYSIFQYFPSHEYAKKAMSEMERVADKGIYIGDLPTESHDSNHLLYAKKDFVDMWNVDKGLYVDKRFDVYTKVSQDDK